MWTSILGSGLWLKISSDKTELRYSFLDQLYIIFWSLLAYTIYNCLINASQHSESIPDS